MVSHNNSNNYSGGREHSEKECFEEYRSIEVENGNKTLRYLSFVNLKSQRRRFRLFFDEYYGKGRCEISLSRYYKEFEFYQSELENSFFSSLLLKASKMLSPYIQKHVPEVSNLNVLYASYFASKVKNISTSVDLDSIYC